MWAGESDDLGLVGRTPALVPLGLGAVVQTIVYAGHDDGVLLPPECVTGSCSDVFYTDSDQDGFGDDATAVVACDPPAGSVAVGGDCDDANADAWPGATEICGNGVDEACDGVPDGCALTHCGAILADEDWSVHDTHPELYLNYAALVAHGTSISPWSRSASGEPTGVARSGRSSAPAP